MPCATPTFDNVDMRRRSMLWRCSGLARSPPGLRLLRSGGSGRRSLWRGTAVGGGIGQLAPKLVSRGLFWATRVVMRTAALVRSVCSCRPTALMRLGVGRGRAMRRVRSRQWHMRPRRGRAVQQFGALRATPSLRLGRASIGGACARHVCSPSGRCRPIGSARPHRCRAHIALGALLRGMLIEYAGPIHVHKGVLLSSER